MCPDLASTTFRIHSVFKNFHFAEWIKKYPNTCGRDLKELFSYKTNSVAKKKTKNKKQTKEN